MRGGIFYPIGGAASQARNPQRTYEDFGISSDGLSVTSGAANTLGSFVTCTIANSGVTAADLCGLLIGIGGVGSTSHRLQITVRKVSGSVVIIPDYHINISDNNFVQVPFPVKVPAGTALEIAIRCSSATQTYRVNVEGIVANSTDSAGFDSMTALSVDTAATRAGSSSAGLILPGDSTWKEIVASTSYDIGALMAVFAEHSTAPATGQRVRYELGLGASGSEVMFWHGMSHVAIAAPYVRSNNPPLIEKYIPSGSRLSARAVAATTTDSYRLGVWEFH